MAINGCGGVSGRAAAGLRLAPARTLRSSGGPQLTRWQVERSVHRAVDDAGLEAGVLVAKRDCGSHDTVLRNSLEAVVSVNKCHLDLAVLQPGGSHAL